MCTLFTTVCLINIFSTVDTTFPIPLEYAAMDQQPQPTTDPSVETTVNPTFVGGITQEQLSGQRTEKQSGRTALQDGGKIGVLYNGMVCFM
jgi:hypothetical protein